MTKEELLPFILLDADEFWANSVNPINADSLFIKAGITNIKEALNFKNSENGLIVRALFENTYIVTGEYIITFMKSMVITNRRLFTFYTGIIKSIPLKNIVTYDQHPSNGLTLTFIESGTAQTFRIGASVLKGDAVNNTLAMHQNDIITEQELILISDTKIVLDAKYGLTIVPEIQSSSQQSVDDAREYQRKGNRNGLILFLIIVSLIGGCGYAIFSWDKSYRESGRAGVIAPDKNHYNSVTGKKQHKCPWCGGIGRVGYAGDSKAQFDRTGMGLGNPCITCNGTGWVDDDN